jgi:glycine C-acetyltransferase
MTHRLISLLAKESRKLEQAGLYKRELTDRSGDAIDLTTNDFLALGDDPSIRDAASRALVEHGFGRCASRAFGGTIGLHTELEAAVASLLGRERAAVFSSGYTANVGLFESILDSRDAIFCDAWVHPSLAEGARLSGARAVPYRNGDFEDLEDKLKRSRAARFRAVVTDGVYPFSGAVANLGSICELAERYDAFVVVDDCLGIGVLGEGGRGTCALRGVNDRVHLVTGSFGKALGGGGGGFVSGCLELIDWLRQKSTTYLFSTALPPVMAGGALEAIARVTGGSLPLPALRNATETLRRGLLDAGFQVLGGEHPSLTVIVGDAVTLQRMVNRLREEGIETVGLCYPVVPEHEARIRVHLSLAHTADQMSRVLTSFVTVGQELGVVAPGGRK